ncbi:hypothetical protein TREMEDRAFT_57424 [Tremella mesenterica DSM 1558]|uniref:uncharacterized protein n=1 Tax=Tremella mesenterica (strain ATCC 24925 / CBS 8224 / DSM 1558 / NBRC 9311 / NRRL Y-6157 / RJB 2259-6 / UBC 559-6) TaxID=578456 RepID=UPI0003F48C19|nr:uncharacterized protein TREMEDRAFT_57424 [Tremella mesenterica DSM 1558]EIW68023.1 hypothetical protein TREMEDRAFT_57424 [Tremella mesenterica DSM 1558]
MHYTPLLLPLLSFSLTVSADAFTRHPRKHALEIAKIRHEIQENRDARDYRIPASRSANGKRLVRKKRAVCQVSFPNNTISTSSSATYPDITSTSTLGQNGWAHGSSTKTSSARPSATSHSNSNSDWTLVKTHSGNSFFDEWDFWQWDDPTHGTVSFQSADAAWSQGLVSVNGNGHAMMKVDTTQNVQGGRKAIRITTQRAFTGGMVLMDAYHMPTGCGTWPAWWQNGPNWPNGGEIDILEGVNAFTQNQVSLHTGSGCKMPNNLNNNQLGSLTTGGFDSYNCASYETSNQGCGVRDGTNDNSYGTGFNNVNGGVYAMVWDKAGIKVWWFPRSSIPSDITNETPDPSGWGTPVANFVSDQCDPYTYFYDHVNIFDTTLCGDWAGADSVWNYAGYAGQGQSCASITGYSTCSDFVLNSGSSFNEAYWEIAYVKYFNSTSQV